jgi:hypothetical protein
MPDKADVWQGTLALMEAGRLVAVGIVIGLIASFGAATLMRGLLFSVSSWDVPTFAAVNPIEALRAE